VWELLVDGKYAAALIVGLPAAALVFLLLVTLVSDGAQGNSFVVAWKQVLRRIRTGTWGSAHDWNEPYAEDEYQEDRMLRQLLKRKSRKK